MNSQHLKRLAIDLNFFQEGPDGSLKLVYQGDNVQSLGTFWESLDPANRWGGNWSSFKDRPHFERREGVSKAASVPSGATAVSPDTSARGGNLLSGAVGVRCSNAPHDVKSIQRLLNLYADRLDLPAPLKCDGIIGEKTLTALGLFQQKVMSASDPEGVVRPGDTTLRALCEILPKGIQETLLLLIYLNAAEESVASLTPGILAAIERYDINTPLRQVHFLAQIGHESGELRFRQEIASGAAYEGRRDLGNTQAGDGVRFKGRGLIQLTGRANYAEYAKTSGLDVDLLANPELVATDDTLCVDVAGWFWERRSLNTIADRDDLETLTRRINGGLNGLDDRRRLLSRAKTLVGA